MLKSLLIKNFAVVSRLEIDFRPGLNVLTGETGTGKSIIVDALGLLVGARGSNEIVRTGEQAAVVEGVFELDETAEIAVSDLLNGSGIIFAKENLTIRREIQAAGRSRIFINDQLATASTLKSLQPLLVEIHGQGEHQSLLGARGQLQLLDEFGGCGGLRRQTAELFTRWRNLCRELQTAAQDEAERERLADFLRFQLREIESVDPRPGEREALERQRLLLLHSERALKLKAETYNDLYESDQSILARLASVRRSLQEWLAIDEGVAHALETVENTSLALTDVAESLRGYGVEDDFSPEHLTAVENRLVELERLRRKYGVNLGELPQLEEELNAQLHELLNWAERERSLRDDLTGIEKEYITHARRLSACRHAAAPELERLVQNELRHVALESSKFLVRMNTALKENRACADDSTSDSAAATQSACFWTASGADQVEFLLSANVGESVRALSRVVSGGELSRLMLVLRTISQKSDSRTGEEGRSITMIFDEIDAGIGGRVAEAVGKRLQTLAATQQVLCVTHQPQVARFADRHYAVTKRVEGERTVTEVHDLDEEAKVRELARMVGGTADVQTARETARWLLESGRRRPSETTLVTAKIRNGSGSDKRKEKRGKKR